MSNATIGLPSAPVAKNRGPSVEGLTPFLIAVMVCCPLWGVTISQATAYFRTYPHDNKYLKTLVGVSVFLATAQLATLIYTTFFWIIVCRDPANYSYLGILAPSLVVVPGYLTYFLTTLVQCFYAMRVWFVSGKKHWLAAILVGLSIIQFVAGFSLITYMATINNITSVFSRFNHVTGSMELGSSMLCDMLISGSLWWYLRQGKVRVFSRTKRALDALILQAVNIGLLTNIIALINLVTWLAEPSSDFTFAVFHFMLGKVYVNSMLVSLNAREKIRNTMDGQHGKSAAYLATTSFNVDSGPQQYVPSDYEMRSGGMSKWKAARNDQLQETSHGNGV